LPYNKCGVTSAAEAHPYAQCKNEADGPRYIVKRENSNVHVSISQQEVLATHLAKWKIEAQGQINAEINELVLAIPSSWSDSQRGIVEQVHSEGIHLF
jgi:molecular chaperone DnaK (HSP70)